MRELSSHQLYTKDLRYFSTSTAKLSFLDKLIYLVNIGHGSTLEVSAIKIVSGFEPICTNVLLKTFGHLAQDNRIDKHALVQRCLGEMGATNIRPNGKALEAGNAVASLKKYDKDPEIEDTLTFKGDIGQQSIMEQISLCSEDTEQTRAMISEIISKPKCSDTLLSKPPFRFIHDLIVAIGKATQFDLCLIFR
jgi:hypothetical protein